MDHIVQTENAVLENNTRELKVAKRYLNIPVKTGAPKKWMRLLQNGKLIRELDIELCADAPSFWAFMDMEQFQGENLTVTLEGVERGETKDFDAITLSDTIIGGENMYQETDRPQFHFTSKRGWLNDPNGLVYYKGEYHLFYQHSPCSWNGSDAHKTWGHAISTDLVHWEELDDALHPDALGSIWSGSAIIDKNNTTGFKTGEEAPMVCIYTSAGGLSPWAKDKPFTQSLAYSNDRGRSFTIYEGNPVQENLKSYNRDPKVFWHEETKQWVIVLYMDAGRHGFLHLPRSEIMELAERTKMLRRMP